MNREHWQHQNGHPPADLLLLHLDGDLDPRDADPVRLHVNQCAECKVSCAQLTRGMAEFVTVRDSIAIPVPAPQTKALRERLIESKASRVPTYIRAAVYGFFRHPFPRRVGFALATAAICLAVWFSLKTPQQSVYASQLLEQARVASDSFSAQSKVLNQKVRLQRGNLIIERNIHHGRPTPLTTRDTRIDAQFQQALDRAHINLNDPLNASDFAAWRSAQSKHTDQVNETAKLVTISTRVGGEPTTQGSLTLSRSDWRPIARSVEFQGEAPIQISEESYDLSDYTAPFTESTTALAAPAQPPTPEPTVSSAVISTDDLEAAEVDLREAFHSTRADITADPQIWRDNNSILFHVSTNSAALKQKVAHAAEQIPHVKESDTAPAPQALASQPPPPTASYPATTPIADSLERELGSPQAATEFLESTRNLYSQAIAEAVALDQLGKRYPVETMKSLPPHLQAKVNNLAARMLSDLQHDTKEYLRDLTPVLDNMAQEQKSAAPSPSTDTVPSCLHWQENAALSSPQLRNLDRSVSLLFVANQPTANPAEKQSALTDSLNAKSFLEHHLMSTCQLFGAG